jgi:hypothetical protein
VFANNTAGVWVGRGKRAGTRGHHTWLPARRWSGCLACTARRGAVQHSAAQPTATQCNAVQRGAARRGAARRSVAQRGVAHRSVAQHSAARVEAGAPAPADTTRRAGGRGRRAGTHRHHTRYEGVRVDLHRAVSLGYRVRSGDLTLIGLTARGTGLIASLLDSFVGLQVKEGSSFEISLHALEGRPVECLLAGADWNSLTLHNSGSK